MPENFLSISTLWLLAGIVLVAVEVFLVPGIGFLFGGLAALVLGAAIVLNIMPADQIIWQLGIWCVLSGIIAVILWKPLIARRSGRAGQAYSNMIGLRAKVVGAPLVYGVTSTVSWSGTQMNARLASESGVVPINAEVEIIAVDGNVLIVKSIG